jgi:hypothetical protein
MAGVRKQADADAITELNVKNLQPYIIDIANANSRRTAVAELTKMAADANLPIIGLVNNAGATW